MSRHRILSASSTRNPRTGDSLSSHPTPEDMIAKMSQRDLQQLVHDLGFEPTGQIAAVFQQLVANLGSVDAAIIALHDDQVIRRAA